MFEGWHWNKFYFLTAHLSKLISFSNSLISWSYSRSLSDHSSMLSPTPEVHFSLFCWQTSAHPSRTISNVSSSGYLPDSCRHSWEILAGASQHGSLITTTALLLCLLLPPRASPPRTEIMCPFFLFSPEHNAWNKDVWSVNVFICSNKTDWVSSTYSTWCQALLWMPEGTAIDTAKSSCHGAYVSLEGMAIHKQIHKKMCCRKQKKRVRELKDENWECGRKRSHLSRF